MIRDLVVVTAPACEPVSLANAKAWCEVESDETHWDTVIALIIQAARERAEEITGRAFVEREVEVVLDEFPDDEVELPIVPVRSVDYIRYLDADGAMQTMSGSPSQWREYLGTDYAMVQPLIGEAWPATRDQKAAVRIGFTCGYAVSGSPVDDDARRALIPAVVKQWMQLRIAGFFANRESLMVGGQFQQPPRDFVDGLLDGLKVNKGFA